MFPAMWWQRWKLCQESSHTRGGSSCSQVDGCIRRRGHLSLPLAPWSRGPLRRCGDAGGWSWAGLTMILAGCCSLGRSAGLLAGRGLWGVILVVQLGAVEKKKTVSEPHCLPSEECLTQSVCVCVCVSTQALRKGDPEVCWCNSGDARFWNHVLGFLLNRMLSWHLIPERRSRSTPSTRPVCTVSAGASEWIEDGS